MKGFLVDVGWGSYGFKAGPDSGKLMAALIGGDQEADEATGGASDERDQILGRQPMPPAHDQPEDGPHDASEVQDEHHGKDQNDNVEHLRTPSIGSRRFRSARARWSIDRACPDRVC